MVKEGDISTFVFFPSSLLFISYRHSLGRPHKHSKTAKEAFEFAKSLLGIGENPIAPEKWTTITVLKGCIRVQSLIQDEFDTFNVSKAHIIKGTGEFENVRIRDLKSVAETPGARKLWDQVFEMAELREVLNENAILAYSTMK
jgi:hypothetical protein